MCQNNFDFFAASRSKLRRRAALRALGLSSVFGMMSAEDEKNMVKMPPEVGNGLKKYLVNLTEGEFLKKGSEIDNLAITRIKDGLRNGADKNDIGLMCVLASKGEWDFLLLLWCSSSVPEARLAVVLLHLSVRDKTSLDWYFDFAARSKIFEAASARVAEVSYMNENLKEFTQLLIPISKSLDEDWYQAVSSK